MDDGVILFHGGLILQGEDPSKPSQMFILVLISSSLRILDGLLSFPPLKDLPLASQQPFLIDVFGLVDQLVFSLDVDVHQFKGIFDQIILYFVVERSVGRETRRVIDLQQYRLSFVIEHHVQPQNVETHVTAVIFRLRAFILMAH